MRIVTDAAGDSADGERGGSANGADMTALSQPASTSNRTKEQMDPCMCLQRGRKEVLAHNDHQKNHFILCHALTPKVVIFHQRRVARYSNFIYS